MRGRPSRRGTICEHYHQRRIPELGAMSPKLLKHFLVTLEYSEDMYHEFSYNVFLEYDQSKKLWRLKADRKNTKGDRLSWRRGKETEDPRAVAVELLYKSYDRGVLLFDVISNNGPFNILMSDITENPNEEKAHIEAIESKYDLVWKGVGYDYSSEFYKSKYSYSKSSSIDYDENGEIQTISGKELMELYNTAASDQDKKKLETVWAPLTKYIKWYARIHKLEKFYEKHNHFDIPINNPKYDDLRKFLTEIDSQIINFKPRWKGEVNFVYEMQPRLLFYLEYLRKSGVK